MSRILIIEDDVVTSTIIARAIELGGFSVDIAKNGLAAIEMIEEQEYVVLVTDMMMPRLDGDELCRRIRDHPHYAEVPILVTTGSVDPAKLAWIDEDPLTELFEKPIQISALVARIASLVQA